MIQKQNMKVFYRITKTADKIKHSNYSRSNPDLKKMSLYEPMVYNIQR